MWPPVPVCRRAALHGCSMSPSSLRGRNPPISRRSLSTTEARATQLSRGGRERPRSPRPGGAAPAWQVPLRCPWPPPLAPWPGPRAVGRTGWGRDTQPRRSKAPAPVQHLLKWHPPRAHQKARRAGALVHCSHQGPQNCFLRGCHENSLGSACGLDPFPW